MSDRPTIDEKNRQKIDDWLLVLLRFAITRDTADRTAGVEFARLLDAGETGAMRSATFFARTTVELCQAIGENDRSQISILRPPSGADRKSSTSQYLSGCGRP
jgi:hypothetical protein